MGAGERRSSVISTSVLCYCWNKKKITREFSKDFHEIFIHRLVLLVIDDAQLCWKEAVRGLEGVEQGNNLKTIFNRDNECSRRFKFDDIQRRGKGDQSYKKSELIARRDR